VIIRRPTTFTFVTDGIDSAVAQAKAAAGDRSVHIMGGASVIQQALNAGLVDELHLHVAPLLLGDGTPLFAALSRIALEPLGVVESTPAIHLRYRALQGEAAPARGSTTLGHLLAQTVWALRVCALTARHLRASSDRARSARWWQALFGLVASAPKRHVLPP
jgi:hypothetical protein